jgi:GrpB-like predicted nucleotidyltransferase (UPF0157 family)
VTETVRFQPEEAVRDAVALAYSEHAARLRSLLPYARIEHVGATAIPGSLTKGDLDICVIVDPERFAEADAVLGEHFARNNGSDRSTSFAAFVADGGAVPTGIQLAATGPEADTFLRWRDLLRRSRELREEYDRLKRLHEGGPMDAYRETKSRFIEDVLARGAP